MTAAGKSNGSEARRGPILVTGGTGTLGSLVVPRLREAGQEVRVLSRGEHEDEAGTEYVVGDLASGEGVERALAGIATVIHAAGSAKGDERKALNLVDAAVPAGVRHIVNISVVGADRLPVKSAIDRAMFGYFAAKLGAERVIEESGIPWTNLRATQFHDLMLMTVRGMSKLPVVPVPSGFNFQPIDAAEVADRLVELALAEPQGLVPEIGGPRTYAMKELLREYLEAAHKHRATFPMHAPGGAARAYREGANLAPDRAVGRRTWEEFLAERLS